MSKIAIIAEKPSVARTIASIVGAKENHEGYLSGNNYLVTWAYGHLIQLAYPCEYGFKNYERASLPMLPDCFKLLIRQVKNEKRYEDEPGAVKQLAVIKSVFDQADEIIVATDAGREGELIFRYIYLYLKCQKPFKRLWISSLTDTAIREGMKQLKDGQEYNNLFLAAKTRSESDWLIGMNASQALTISAGQGGYSLGRVQTPTLNMICTRFLENKNFVPQKYFQVKVQTEKSGTKFFIQSEQKYSDRKEAEKDLQQISGEGVKVTEVQGKDVNVEPPLLYDLTTLQRDANTKYGFPADKTLSIAQRLYEGRFTTYPRTGSRFIAEDVYNEIPGLIDSLEAYPRFSVYAKKMKGSTLNHRSVNAEKVTDHHALLITPTRPTGLTEDETRIYDLIAGRMLEAFSVTCIQSVTTHVLHCGNLNFSVKATIVKSPGWKEVSNDTEQGEETENTILPVLTENETLPLLGAEIAEKQTKPRPIHTDASLLGVMETAGKELENEKEREALKNIGIGTPATRAGIIETLVARLYIRRDKKNLIPTERGIAVYNLIKDMKISNVQMTAEWEVALNKIESGEMNADTFRKGIEIHTAQITAELLNLNLGNIGNNGCSCPKCNTGKITFFPKVAKCNNPECGLLVFRSKCEKLISDEQLNKLFKEGKTDLMKNFKKKDGKTFSATLKFDEQYNVVMEFPEIKKKDTFKKK